MGKSLLLVLLLAFLLACVVASSHAQVNIMISLNNDGTQSQHQSWLQRGGAISGDGRYIVFSSYAPGLIDADTQTNHLQHVYLRDQLEKKNYLLSRNSTGGAPAKYGISNQAVISGDGNVVAFVSGAVDLVPNDFNGNDDIFLYDRKQGKIVGRANVATGGQEATGLLGHSANPSLNEDGTVIAFQSAATNLVPDDTNGWTDVFVHYTANGTTIRASVGNNGEQANGPDAHTQSVNPMVSRNGRYVVFESTATNLVPNDNLGFRDIFVRDLWTGTTTLVSANVNGGLADADSSEPSISADGRYITFTSLATNVASPASAPGYSHIYVRDMVTKTTRRVSFNPKTNEQGNGNSFKSVISADGSYVVFQSICTNLISDFESDYAGFSDIFRYDRVRNEMEQVTRKWNSNLGQPNGASDVASISADGSKVLYQSVSTNLLGSPSKDTNQFQDVYMTDFSRDPTEQETVYDPSDPDNGRYESAAVKSAARASVFSVIFAALAAVAIAMRLLAE